MPLHSPDATLPSALYHAARVSCLTLSALVLAQFAACSPFERPAVLEADISVQSVEPLPVEAEKEPHNPYSPFIIELEGGPVDNISFKDVGLSFDDESLAVYEALATALAQEIGAASTLPWAAQTAYEIAVTDPNNHVFCGDRHVYIDTWRSQSPDRWGYSLWSGCGEESQFAWEELETDQDAWLENVTPVARAIVEDLSDALATGCFRRAC